MRLMTTFLTVSTERGPEILLCMSARSCAMSLGFVVVYVLYRWSKRNAESSWRTVCLACAAYVPACHRKLAFFFSNFYIFQPSWFPLFLSPSFPSVFYLLAFYLSLSLPFSFISKIFGIKMPARDQLGKIEDRFRFWVLFL